MSITVGQGSAAIPVGSYPSNYYYFVANDTTTGTPAGENVNIATADVANPRIDVIVAFVDVAVTPSSGTPNNPNNMLKLAAVAGTPAGSPVAPNAAAIQAAVGASNPYIILANVFVGASVTQITSANITDRRTIVTVNRRHLQSLVAPQGHLLNGRIVTSVASNNLTFAVKTLENNDPSVSDPVLCRIGNSIRAITAPLSRTINAGTNTFNAGSASLAGFEIDYFCYLIWNTTPTTDRVDIGAARIPYGRTFADFSTTATNEKFLAFSGADTPASTDEVEVIGRFNATLSAAAAHNWSIPATSVIVNRPIFTTRHLSYSPALTALSGGTTTADYVIRDKQAVVRFRYVLSGAGVSGTPRVTMPLAAASKYNVADNTQLGMVWMNDTGVANYHGVLVMSSVTGVSAVDMYAWGASGTYLGIASLSSTIPFTWGNTDSIVIDQLMYEIA